VIRIEEYYTTTAKWGLAAIVAMAAIVGIDYTFDFSSKFEAQATDTLNLHFDGAQFWLDNQANQYNQHIFEGERPMFINHTECKEFSFSAFKAKSQNKIAFGSLKQKHSKFLIELPYYDNPGGDYVLIFKTSDKKGKTIITKILAKQL